MAQGTINVVRGSDSDASLKTAGAICAHHRTGRGSGSGDGEYKRFDAEPFYTAVAIGQGKSKNHGFLAAFFSIFLSLLKEIWPPEA